MSSTAMSPGFVFMQVEYNGGAQILIDCYFQLRRWVSCLSTWSHYPSSNCALQNWSAENEALLNIDLKAFHLVKLIEIGNMMFLVKNWRKYYSSTCVLKKSHCKHRPFDDPRDRAGTLWTTSRRGSSPRRTGLASGRSARSVFHWQKLISFHEYIFYITVLDKKLKSISWAQNSWPK